MDVVIFFKAVGNFLFAAILFLAVVMTTFLSLLTYLFRELKPKLVQKRSEWANNAKLLRTLQHLGVRKSVSGAAKIPADYWHQ